jgi:hypothetical protein
MIRRLFARFLRARRRRALPVLRPVFPPPVPARTRIVDRICPPPCAEIRPKGKGETARA